MKAKIFLLMLNALIISLFCGCFGGRTAPAQYYRLASEASAVKDVVCIPPVTQLRVDLPDYLRRQEIVETGGRNLMYLKEDARWGHALSEGIRDALMYRLAKLNDNTAYKCPDKDRQDSVRLEYRFWKFSGDRDGSLQVRGMGRIVLLPARETISFRIDFSLPYNVRSTESLVLAHDQALARLTETTAAQIKAWYADRTGQKTEK